MTFHSKVGRLKGDCVDKSCPQHLEVPKGTVSPTIPNSKMFIKWGKEAKSVRYGRHRWALQVFDQLEWRVWQKKSIPTGIQIRILPVPAFNPTKEHPGAPMFGIILGLDPKKWLVFQSTVTATAHIPSQYVCCFPQTQLDWTCSILQIHPLIHTKYTNLH